MTDLETRADGHCELCSAGGELHSQEVEATPHAALVCGVCHGQLASGELDANHWHCLQSSIWSDVPAVQILSYRLLHQLQSEGWARDLLDQAYLADDVLALAKAGIAEPEADDRPRTVDSNGAVLADGDSVTLIRDLDVKGAGFTAKRGTLVKGIRLTDNPAHVEGKVNKMAIVLKTEFLKKA